MAVESVQERHVNLPTLTVELAESRMRAMWSAIWGGGRFKHLKPHGFVYKKLAEGMPSIVIKEDGSCSEIEHRGRLLLRFTRLLPDDLRDEFYDAFDIQNRGFSHGKMQTFVNHMTARSSEIPWPDVEKEAWGG